MIRATDLTRRFGALTAVDRLTVEVARGEIFGLVGPDGAGKTTTLRLLCGLLEPTQGQVWVAGQLSGGMRQKLALMCTLLHRPQVLLLDEPTTGVDPLSRRDFWTILYEVVRDGMTVFITTAYLDEAERANRVGLMHRGRLIACDTPAALRSLLPGARSFEDVFIALIREAQDGRR